ncbi:putative transcriptional regulator [Bacillus sp. TS-2]|nr:putative transcriptional regulator [Bacillus sp. TS-2]
MKVDDFRILVALEEAKTIRAAAKVLLISQPAVSQRLKNIESEWGKELFIRTPQQLILTPNGEKVVNFARKMLAEHKLVQHDLLSDSEVISGTLSLGVSSIISQYVLPPILKEYLSLYPKVQLELVSGLSSEIHSSHHSFHLSITRGEKLGIEESFLLFQDPLYLIDSIEGKPSSTYIEFQTDSSFQSIVNDWFSQTPQYKPLSKIKVDQIETSKQLLKNGIGKTVLPRTAIYDLDLAQYQLIPLMKTNKMILRDTWLTYSSYSQKLPQVDAFLKLIQSKNFHFYEQDQLFLNHERPL